MKNNKAFTLIELLSIIVVLGVITIVAVPTLTASNKKSKQRDYDEFVQTIKNAAEIYVETHQDNPGVISLKNGGTYNIKIEELIATGLLNKNLINPNTNAIISTDGIVRAAKSGNTITYTYP